MLLVGLEALRNAARHAAARHVELRLLPRRGGSWELSVIDDGVGLGNEATAEAVTRALREGLV